MALKGQLHDFNLAEILQLIGTQQKSGFLVLEGHREMVFVFDKGTLISTRDRRSEAPDPLETFLRNYGFFTETQWAHIAYIRQNATLDLAEILLSEELLSKPELDAVLQNVAREMAHKGMKMRRGRYHFTATSDTPPGVRWRIAMDVQGLLMEAARRVDEEAELVRLFPSQAVTFVAGPKPPAAETMSPTANRIIKLALGGRPLGRIIRLARTDSFATRETLKRFLDSGWLEMVMPEADGQTDDHDQAGRRKRHRQRDLRSPLISTIAVLVILGFGAFRWAPLMFGEVALIGLAAPAPAHLATGDQATLISWLDEGQQACRDLRLRQLQAEIGEAARQYQSTHGAYPEGLERLVQEGLLPRDTWRTIDRLGWQYARLESGQSYRLAL